MEIRQPADRPASDTSHGVNLGEELSAGTTGQVPRFLTFPNPGRPETWENTQESARKRPDPDLSLV